MNTTAEVFEIEPFRHELEARARPTRGGVRSALRHPVSKPWPSFRRRRILRTPSTYGGWGGTAPDAGAEPQAEPEPPRSVASPEYVRWLQSTLNRAIGGTLPVDGIMSAAVRDAIREFQRNNRLPASGYIGPDTESALRRAGDGSEREQLEFEWEAGLRGDALAVDAALSRRKALPIRFVLKSLGRQPVPGLYRFFTADGRFYTGMATDLRQRIIQHLWCLSHFGIETRNHRLVLCRMPGKTNEQIRAIEVAINRHYKDNSSRLNKTTELEFLELSRL
jgi:peptidoglycan hydrolase-like protein with peptidoglycan-binding domain